MNNSPYRNADILGLCAAVGIDCQIAVDEDGRPVALPDPAGLMRLREDALRRGFFALVPLFDDLIRDVDDA